MEATQRFTPPWPNFFQQFQMGIARLHCIEKRWYLYPINCGLPSRQCLNSSHVQSNANDGMPPQWISRYALVSQLRQHQWILVVLTRLRRFRIAVNSRKSFFAMDNMDFLGHNICELGLTAHPKDIEGFRALPFPTTLRAMQSFLGCLNFYSRFIDLFSMMHR